MLLRGLLLRRTYHLSMPAAAFTTRPNQFTTTKKILFPFFQMGDPETLKKR